MVSVNPRLTAFASVPQDKIRSGLTNRWTAGSLVQLRLCSGQMPPEWKPGPHPPLYSSVSKKIIQSDRWLTRSFPANYGHLVKSLSINFVSHLSGEHAFKQNPNDITMTSTPETHLSLNTPCCPLEGSAEIVLGIV